MRSKSARQRARAKRARIEQEARDIELRPTVIVPSEFGVGAPEKKTTQSLEEMMQGRAYEGSPAYPVPGPLTGEPSLVEMMKNREYVPFYESGKAVRSVENLSNHPSAPPTGMVVKSNQQSYRRETYEKGVTMLVNGLGLIRSAFVECDELAGSRSPNAHQESWMRTDMDLRSTRRSLEQVTKEHEALLSEHKVVLTEKAYLEKRVNAALDYINENLNRGK